MRYQVRTATSEVGPTLHRVWDTVERVYVETFTRAALAEAAATRLERAWRQEATRVGGARR